jgi:hypothetical protein
MEGGVGQCVFVRAGTCMYRPGCTTSANMSSTPCCHMSCVPVLEQSTAHSLLTSSSKYRSQCPAVCLQTIVLVETTSRDLQQHMFQHASPHLSACGTLEAWWRRLFCHGAQRVAAAVLLPEQLPTPQHLQHTTNSANLPHLGSDSAQAGAMARGNHVAWTCCWKQACMCHKVRRLLDVVSAC